MDLPAQEASNNSWINLDSSAAPHALGSRKESPSQFESNVRQHPAVSQQIPWEWPLHRGGKDGLLQHAAHKALKHARVLPAGWQGRWPYKQALLAEPAAAVVCQLLCTQCRLISGHAEVATP